MSIEKFREYLKEYVAPNKNRWHEVANNMTDHYLHVTIDQAENFRNEINFLLREIDLSESEEFQTLKQISDTLFRQRNATVEYDSISSFLSVYWQLFSGWDFVDGYRQKGIVESLIDEI